MDQLCERHVYQESHPGYLVLLKNLQASKIPSLDIWRSGGGIEMANFEIGLITASILSYLEI